MDGVWRTERGREGTQTAERKREREEDAPPDDCSGSFLHFSLSSSVSLPEPRGVNAKGQRSADINGLFPGLQSAGKGTDMNARLNPAGGRASKGLAFN